MPDVQLAQPEPLAVGEQLVPLRPVRGKIVREIVELFPELLDLDHPGAGRDWRACPALQVVGGGKVVGVRMGVDDPLDGKPLSGDVVEQPVG
jgi:hypothetical protein